uniref:Uncharacterized protein n=1 Tax=Bionectria ochroleuca TaxID=29856 RepID=A0A8H7NNL2_BIOOC
MRTSTFTALLGLGLLPLGLAQSSSSVNPGPSPTNSVGCEPHGDHWHCEGPATQTGAVTSATGSASVTASHSHDHEDDDDHSSGTASLKPSPTESAGCEPHGDHWHCTGPATGAASVTTPLLPTLMLLAPAASSPALPSLSAVSLTETTGTATVPPPLPPSLALAPLLVLPAPPPRVVWLLLSLFLLPELSLLWHLLCKMMNWEEYYTIDCLFWHITKAHAWDDG